MEMLRTKLAKTNQEKRRGLDLPDSKTYFKNLYSGHVIFVQDCSDIQKCITSRKQNLRYPADMTLQ